MKLFAVLVPSPVTGFPLILHLGDRFAGIVTFSSGTILAHELSFTVGDALKTMSKNFSSLILMKLCDHVGIWFIRVCFKFGLKIPLGSA